MPRQRNCSEGKIFPITVAMSTSNTPVSHDAESRDSLGDMLSSRSKPQIEASEAVQPDQGGIGKQGKEKSRNGSIAGMTARARGRSVPTITTKSVFPGLKITRNPSAADTGPKSAPIDAPVSPNARRSNFRGRKESSIAEMISFSYMNAFIKEAEQRDLRLGEYPRHEATEDVGLLGDTLSSEWEKQKKQNAKFNVWKPVVL